MSTLAAGHYEHHDTQYTHRVLGRVLVPVLVPALLWFPSVYWDPQSPPARDGSASGDRAASCQIRKVILGTLLPEFPKVERAMAVLSHSSGDEEYCMSK
ncbi:hypothetical protein AAE478_007736 [Parahypoxylon ruwenzoriense]